MAKENTQRPHVASARPLVRAYLLGYLSSTSPRIIGVLLSLARKKIGLAQASRRILLVLRQSAAFDAFPAFCGLLVGGSTLLQLPLLRMIHMIVRHLPDSIRAIDHMVALRLARFLAALSSAFLSFHVLNHRPASRIDRMTSVASSKPQVASRTPQLASQTLFDPFEDPPETPAVSTLSGSANVANVATQPLALAGRTMDLTLFAVIRALDIAISELWTRTPVRSTRVRSAVSSSTPPVLFSASVATIMYAWFYTPSRLPSAYNSWISSAAELDHRLMLVLRHARYGTFIYGKNTGMAPVLESMCRDYNLPEAWGDPAKTIPVPCELVHMGCGANCETHALTRFIRGWLFAARMYAPLQLLILFRNAHRRALTPSTVAKATVDMARSSAFLGSFIALFYYGVCLARTRLGPRLFSRKTISPQMWDSGLCVLAGCCLCGCSIGFETAQKRLEILFFVLPRAAAVWFPRRYLKENKWREQCAFALSTALVFATAQERPERVRGFLGRVLRGVLAQEQG